MAKNPQKVRTAIRRQNAERYLLITLFSFAASVSLTRLFLELTGYPQLGNSELHIAHVLWGGLILFVGALVPLIIANRWAFYLSALLTGIGVGLFIDEVGKFITQTNDYFYPSAAPIIYTFFLLTVLLYLIIRRNRSEDPRSDLYIILQDLEEVVDRDLSEPEQARLKHRLENVIEHSPDPELSHLAEEILRFIESDRIVLVPEEHGWLNRIENEWNKFEQLHLNQRRFKAVLVGGLTAWAAWTIAFPFSVLVNINSQEELELILSRLVESRLVNNPAGITWFGARVGLEGSVGLLVLIAAVFIIIGRDRRGIWLAFISLIFSITVVQVLLFYFDQFSTIISALVQFILFLGVQRYRRRFLEEPE